MRFFSRVKNQNSTLAISLRAIVLLSICLCFFMEHLSANESEDHSVLFKELPDSANAGIVLPNHAVSNKGRAVSIDAKALHISKLTIQLFEGKSVFAKRSRSIKAKDNASISWIGEVDGYPGSLVIFTERNGVIAGNISFGSELYEVNPTSNGNYVLFQVDEESLPPFCSSDNASDITEESNNSSLDTTVAESYTASALSTDYIIDLMVVYTPASRNRWGQNNIEAMIINAVESTNQAYLNSQINMQLNIVHMAEINYTETGDMGVTLSDLRGTTDGYMEEVHDWRDTYRADMVTMISEDSNYCGKASLMTSESLSFAPRAFSVTYSSCLSNKTLAHELGHNQGNMHDRANSSYGGVYPYSYGHRRCVNDGTGFRTVMSYSCSGGTRENYFSNPNVDYNGYPTGINHTSDPDNSADCARSMNNTADTVAAFLDSIATTPPYSPSGLVANAVDYNQIDLNWTDNSTDETGFRVERSLDLSSWTEIATVGIDVNSYNDNSLDANTTYHYQVRAYNSARNSDYSNVSSATTLGPLPPPDAPSNLTAVAVSGGQIDLGWSDVTGELGYRIERSEDEQNWSSLATLGQDTTAYSDTDNLQPSTTYYYHVIAFNSSSDSSLSNTASATTLSTVKHFATAETPVSGQIYGDYANTWDDDNTTQMISEVESGGKPSKRYSYLEHTWHFNITTGFSVSFYANTYKSNSNEDNFIFQYSTDGQNFTDIFEVNSIATNNVEIHQLPTTLSGNVYIRVIDTDQTKGNKNLESIYVDQMYIQVESDASGTAPAALSNLTATALSANQVSLTWYDNSTNEYGFQIERSLDGISWSILDNVDADSTSYEDYTVTSSTTYYYRVSAYNGSGSSSYTTSASVTTPQGIMLSATGYKVKGTQQADLIWSGTNTADVIIYRNGKSIATVVNNGKYTDNIGSKGRGSYTYQICESGGGSCSNNVDVVF